MGIIFFLKYTLTLNIALYKRPKLVLCIRFLKSAINVCTLWWRLETIMTAMAQISIVDRVFLLEYRCDNVKSNTIMCFGYLFHDYVYRWQGWTKKLSLQHSIQFKIISRGTPSIISEGNCYCWKCWEFLSLFF